MLTFGAVRVSVKAIDRPRRRRLLRRILISCSWAAELNTSVKVWSNENMAEPPSFWFLLRNVSELIENSCWCRVGGNVG